MYNHQSHHCYPGTNVLKNKFDEKNQKALDVLETGFTTKRLLDLELSPIVGKFDLTHLQKIHEYIFQDLYPFAGQLRNENIAKGSFSFADARFIKPAAEDLFNQLNKEKQLSGLDIKEFSNKAAYFMGELNVLHPFREGNGRTQREFIRTLAVRNGFDLDWSKVDKEKILSVSIKSVNDYRPLADVIEQSISNQEPNIALKKSYLKPISRELDR